MAEKETSPENSTLSVASSAPGDERYLVPALIRGLTVLQRLSRESRGLTLSEVAAALGVTRSSAYRLLFTLGHLGFVVFDANTKTYALGPEVLRLGYGYLAPAATRRSIASTVHVGTRLPARATTMGRILLSGLTPDEVRDLYRDQPYSSEAGQGSLADLDALLATARANGVVVQNSGYEPG